MVFGYIESIIRYIVYILIAVVVAILAAVVLYFFFSYQIGAVRRIQRG
jgi:hypothetical protein